MTMTISGTAGATFPDSTTQATAARSGGTATSSAVDITLTSSSTQTQLVTMTAANKSVILPDATTLGKGEGMFEVTASATSYSLYIKNNAGDILYGPVGPGTSVQLSLVDNSAAAGTWTANGTIAKGGFGPVNVSTIAVQGEISTSYNHMAVKVVGLSATSAAILFFTNSTTLKVVIVTVSGTTVTWGTPVTVTTSTFLDDGAGFVFCAALSSTLFTVVYGTAFSPYIVAISVSGTTPTLGTAVDLGTTTLSPVQNYALSSTEGLLTYVYSSSASNYEVRVRGYSVSGTTITLGTASTALSKTSSALMCKSVKTSSNSFCVIYSFYSTNNLYLRSYTFSGTTLTAGSQVDVGTGGTIYNTTTGAVEYWTGIPTTKFNWLTYSPASNVALFFNTSAPTAISVVTSGTTISSYSQTQVFPSNQPLYQGAVVGFGSSGQALYYNSIGAANGAGSLYLMTANSDGVQGCVNCFPTFNSLISSYDALGTQTFLLASVATSGTNSYLTAQILKVV